MNTPDLFATLPRHALNRECRTCKAPITLRMTPGGTWVPFDADPVVLQTVQEGASLIRGGRVLEMLSADDRHECQRDER